MFVQIELGPCTFGPCRNSQATSPLSCWQNIHISLSGLIEASIICQWKVPNMRVSVIDLARNGFLFLKSARPEYASARLDPGVNAPRPVSYLKAIYIYLYMLIFKILKTEDLRKPKTMMILCVECEFFKSSRKTCEEFSRI